MNIEKKETKLKDKSKRERRTRLGLSGPLYIDPEKLDPTKRYVLVNDTPGSIQKRQRMGYTIVQNKDITVGDSTVMNSSKLGTVVSVDVGRSTDMKGILMEISAEDHAELLEEYQELADEQLSATQEQEGKSIPGFSASVRKTN